MTADRVVRAAGTIPWREKDGVLEVALVHRPRWDDWSWPKGKLEDGEDATAAAVRETAEETGLLVRLGRPLPIGIEKVRTGGAARRKEVRYWAGEVVGGHGRLEHEIDDLRWVTPTKARRLLTHRHDLDQLKALVGAPVRTRPVAIVRHAHAVARKRFHGEDDRLRPLDEAGRSRAEALSPILSAYGFAHIVSSPSTRCAETMSPYLDAHPDVVASWCPELSEEGHAADPTGLVPVIGAAADDGRPTAICSHGPVHRAIADELARHYRTPGKGTKRIVRSLVRNNLKKGEAVVLHVDTGRKPAVLAMERHLP